MEYVENRHDSISQEVHGMMRKYKFDLEKRLVHIWVVSSTLKRMIRRYKSFLFRSLVQVKRWSTLAS